MKPTLWPGYSQTETESDKEDGFELLDHRSTAASTTNDWTTPTSRLPPKNLPLRTTTQVVRKLFWTGFLVIVAIVGLCILISKIPSFLRETFVKDLESRVSCDLSINQGGKLQNAFTLNLRGATHLTFGEAKAIDVIWQLFVGAGGRLWLAWISYRVFMDGLTRLTEQSPITYNLYAHLTFSTTSISSTYYALKAVYNSKGWPSKLFMLWFGLSTTYVLGFPTLMSATAGYVSPSTAGYKMSNGAFLTPDSDDLRTCYTLYDGSVIGQSNNSVVQGPPVSVFNPFPLFDYETGSRKPWPDVSNFNTTYPLYAFLTNLTYTPSRRVYDATNDTVPYSRGQGSGPNWLDLSDRNFTSNVIIIGHVYRFRNYVFSSTYCYQNRSIADLDGLAECLPEKFFVWGFSSLMVYISLSLLILWIFGMYIVWLDANIYSALCRSGRKVQGHLRAVADLSEAMREVLGDETCAYSASELARELSSQPGLRYYASESRDSDVSHIGLSSRRLGRVPFNSTKLYGKHVKDC